MPPEVAGNFVRSILFHSFAEQKQTQSLDRNGHNVWTETDTRSGLEYQMQINDRMI